ncbi:DUF3139 domain-containing protein [Psychrobacillus sp. NEAU-3TGS]|uniref:DUF3139 domain-containing protein n=1 Tax=Psychrobacillus sp. NEAU-3TGS TaxID=2995412 RepID=UPI002498A540|nr:DUF3139 domain-containing protein [Psychrobacillus sp. NEAU-3TGS]MDI2588728.1 DUF3139 domain-containing protein [Psychrobacillus sp. NEAU-3TGS]
MTRAKKIFWVLLVIAIIGIVIVPIVTIQANKHTYKKRVANYLIEEKGYEKENIESIEGKWGIKLPTYYVIVTFQNETYVEYVYFAHDNDIFQFNYKITEEGQQMEIKEEDLINYNPRY